MMMTRFIAAVLAMGAWFTLVLLKMAPPDPFVSYLSLLVALLTGMHASTMEFPKLPFRKSSDTTNQEQQP